MDKPKQQVSAGRRSFIAGTATAIAAGTIVLPRFARGAEFQFKYGSELPTGHPQNVRAKEAIDRIREQTSGRVDIAHFSNGALGSITDMISQARSGALEMLTVSPANLSTFDLKASTSIPYAFKSYDDVWAAIDGDLGAFSRRVIAQKTGLQVFDTLWDHGFRQITTRTKPIVSPDDLKNFKMRVAVAPIYISLFKSLGSSPTAINFSELYTSLQTKVVDGQENSLALIDSAKLYEVQTNCSVTNHIWEGYVTTCNMAAWKRLTPELQQIVVSSFKDAALKQREDMKALAASLQASLTTKGLRFNTVDAAPFRKTLSEAGFFKEWKEKFGADYWAVLEKYSGPLA